MEDKIEYTVEETADVLNESANALWCTLELNGHNRSAGLISISRDWDGLFRLDVPIADGGFYTELYGKSAIYRVRFVPEQVARAKAPAPEDEILTWDIGLVTQDEYNEALNKMREEKKKLTRRVFQAEREMEAVRAMLNNGGESDSDGDAVVSSLGGDTLEVNVVENMEILMKNSDE